MFRSQKVSWLIVFLSIFIIDNAYAACTGSSPTWYCTPDYTSLNNLINNNSPGTVQSGDTINVSAGSSTWNSALVIKKGLILKGAGVGNTVITSNITDQNNGIISFKPDAATRAANAAFRVTGFTLNGNYKSNCLLISNYSVSIMNKIRLDHNHFLNPGGSNAGYVLVLSGTVYGVVDNNTIEGQVDPMGIESLAWANYTSDFGAANARDGIVNNMYYEDNIWIRNDTFIHEGHGGRYVVRYNTFSGATKHYFPMFDMHGNSKISYGTIVAEIYGNKIITGIYGGNLLDQRGGQALVFNNYNEQTANQTNYIKVREEYDDATMPAANNYIMKVNNSYYWNNRHYNQALITPYIGQDTFDPDISLKNNPVSLAENREFFNQNPNYNGTTQRGVYCGSSLPATCTTGDGAWITTQSCSSISSANVGANPITPIAGTLYKCIAPNRWVSYYTPYTYPHPLRAENPVSAPGPPRNFNLTIP